MTMPRKSDVDPLLINLFESKFSKSDLRKVAIVKSAIKIIASKGIEETSFESIGKPLRIRRSHVAYHFKDKSDIIETAIKYVIAKGQELTIERVQEAETARDKVVAIVEAFFDWAASDPDAIAVYVLFFYYCSINEHYKKLHAEIRKTGADRLRAVLEQDSVFGRKHDKAQLESISKNIQALAVGSLVDLLSTSSLDAKSVQTAKRRTVEGVLSFLD